MKSQSISFLILLAALAGCKKDNLSEGAANGDTRQDGITIYASLTSEDLISDGDEGETRVSISDEGATRWQEGDRIALHHSGGFATFTLSNASTGAFDGPSGTYDGLAVSPWECSPRLDGGRLLITFPGSYAYMPGRSYVPMIAVSEGSDYCFYPCSGLVKIPFSSVPEGTRLFRFASSHKIQGEFMLGTPVPGTSAVQMGHPANDLEKEVIFRIQGSQVSSRMDFYIPLPVTSGDQAYESFALSLLDGDGKLLASRVSSTPRTVVRRQLLRFKTMQASMPSKIYLLGGCFETPWVFSEELTLSRGADGKYRGYGINFTSSEGFKIYLADQWTAEWFGADASLNLVNGPALRRTQDPSSDTQVTPAFTGSADITVDFASGSIAMVPHSDVVYPSALSIIGDAVGGWDAANRIRIPHTGNGIYRVEGVSLNFGTSGELGFKFVPVASDEWYPQYAQELDGGSEPNIDFGKVRYVAGSGESEAQFYPGRHGYASGAYTVELDIPNQRMTVSTGEGGGGGGDEGGSFLERLAALRRSGTMFGQQIPTEYGLSGGVKWWDDGSINNSDVKILTGSHPAVCGWDISGIELGNSRNIDGEDFTVVRQHIQAAWQRGAVNTLSWHCANPVTGGNSWDNTPAAYTVIPGGANHEKFKLWLDRVAAFLKSLTTPSGEQIPLIFRPWHEHTGNGFWWGKGSASQSDYVAMWRFTFDYLRNTKGVENLISAYSPDAIHFIWNPPGDYSSIYLEYWPGDAYVDILGLDAYDDLNNDRRFMDVVPTLCQKIAELAVAKDKIAALTETGLENNYSVSNWWTQRLYQAIRGKGLSYALVWRNGDIPPAGHFFGPWKGCYSENDFITFANYSDILLERDLPALYE